jgi:hypothetical protein
MQIDESRKFSVEFSLNTNIPSNTKNTIPYTTRERTVVISAGNFESKPNEKRAFIIEQLGVKKALWSIPPKNTEKHILIVNVTHAFLMIKPHLQLKY